MVRRTFDGYNNPSSGYDFDERKELKNLYRAATTVINDYIRECIVFLKNVWWDPKFYVDDNGMQVMKMLPGKAAQEKPT